MTGIFYVGVERTAIDAAITKSTTLSLIIAGSIILGGAALLAGLIYVLLRPLGVIAKTIKQVADGDLDTRIPFTDRSDQIGAIALQIESFQHKLQQARVLEHLSASKKAEQEYIVSKLRRALEKLADKDLSPRMIAEPGQEFSADYTGLRDDFNGFVTSLSTIISEVGDIASSVDRAAAGIGSGSSDLALRIERQANTLAESAAALDGLTMASNGIVTKADQADSVAKTSRSLSAESRKALDAAMGSINKIEASSGAINQIITVIEDIAFQTNLLALNAGVEAARAGDAGRGFAVVASEVRGLAKNATDSAQQIKKLILSSNEQVKEGNQLVQNTGQVLGQVLVHVETLGSLVSDIAGEVRNQSDSLEQVNGGVRQLDHMTQQNAAMVEETNAAVQQLRKEASRLSQMLSGFRTTAGQVHAMRSTAAVNDRGMTGLGKMAAVTQHHSRPVMTGTGPASMDWANF